jgi:hypothetical protein
MTSPNSVDFFAAILRRRCEPAATEATGPGDSGPVIEAKYFANLELDFNSTCSDR